MPVHGREAAVGLTGFALGAMSDGSLHDRAWGVLLEWSYCVVPRHDPLT